MPCLQIEFSPSRDVMFGIDIIVTNSNSSGKTGQSRPSPRLETRPSCLYGLARV